MVDTLLSVLRADTTGEVKSYLIANGRANIANIVWSAWANDTDCVKSKALSAALNAQPFTEAETAELNKLIANYHNGDINKLVVDCVKPTTSRVAPSAPSEPISFSTTLNTNKIEEVVKALLAAGPGNIHITKTNSGFSIHVVENKQLADAIVGQRTDISEELALDLGSRLLKSIRSKAAAPESMTTKLTVCGKELEFPVGKFYCMLEHDECAAHAWFRVKFPEDYAAFRARYYRCRSVTGAGVSSWVSSFVNALESTRADVVETLIMMLKNVPGSDITLEDRLARIELRQLEVLDKITATCAQLLGKEDAR